MEYLSRRRFLKISAATFGAGPREMAGHRPATSVHPGRRTNWYGNDAQRCRASALLNALLGSWGCCSWSRACHPLRR
jgi:hypothetical protein